MKVTIKDIAREAGLSPTAVSLVLNNRPNKISVISKKKILDAAARLQYRVRSTAELSANRQTRNIGQIIPDISNYFFAKLIHGVETVVHANQFGLLISSSENNPQRELSVIESMISKKVDGILITSSASIDLTQYQKIMEDVDIPIVLVDRIIPTLPYSSMTFNQKKGGFLATKHLLDLGHKRIACITGGPETNPNTSPRINGYRWAMESELGVTVTKDCIMQCDYSSASGYKIADTIFASDFTAVFSCNDMMAYGIYKRARERKIRIPEDISIVGFDDLEFSLLIDPPLTTIKQSAFELGREAANRLLLEMQERTISKQSIYFEPSLIVRSSTTKLKD